MRLEFLVALQTAKINIININLCFETNWLNMNIVGLRKARESYTNIHFTSGFWLKSYADEKFLESKNSKRLVNK